MKREPIDVDALKRERQRILDEAGDIISVANREDRELAKDEQERYDRLMADATKRLAQIRNEDTMREAENAGEKPRQPYTKPHPSESPTYVGMTQTDIENFSIRRLIAAKAGLIPQHEARLELEITEEVAKRSGKPFNERQASLPFEVTAGMRQGMERRDITIGTEGADIREVTHAGLIELLRNKMVVRQAGARFITGLRGNLHYPKHTGADNPAAWVTEVASPTERTQTFGQVLMVPKQLATFSDISRQTLLQSSFDIEMMVRDDLAAILAIELDRAALHGSGTGAEPTGVLATAGIGAVTLATSGSSALTYGNIIQLETEVAQDNADIGALAYITNTKVRGALKQREKVASTGLFMWQDPANIAPAQTGAPLNGYSAFVTNQVSSALTKGTGTGLSAIFFGNWNELLVGIWSDLDILVDPYTGGTAGIVRVIALLNADIGVRHAESFAAISDLLV